MKPEPHIPQHNLPPLSDKEGSFFGELIRFVLISLAIVIPVRLYIAEPFIVSGSSMTPTFETGHYLIVDQVSYRFDAPERGDVVVFRYPKDPSKFFIKRVIGLPGETIRIKDKSVLIYNETYPDGLLLNEPYIKDMPQENTETALGESEYFVMGDNRGASSDSRIWGPLEKDEIVGQAFLRLFPVTEFGVLPGEYNQ